ncbi:uncharacterized protein B0T23DRAFT_405806 [Neurospora hispaniola]|uniref:Uncharacterized protein n=1 Tax=Neurospora hispaniola TaxID=588809 RepID=A0AAJ0I6Q0_9PEZI|nr:hypothetical protein B0T23DRAFT_405806 [Neurospora hispaniola]
MDKCFTALARCVPSVIGMGGFMIWSSEVDGWKSGCREDWIWLRRSPYYKVPAGMGAWVEERVAKRHNRDPIYPVNPERSERTGIVKDSRHKLVSSVPRQLDATPRVGWLATRSDFASTCADPWSAPMFGSAHFRKAEEEPCRHCY